MTYSVQQIKFELISYVKEFGGDFTQWSVGKATDAPKALFEIHDVDPVEDIWLWKPALTAVAAGLVVDWMTQRQNVAPVDGDDMGACVFMFKKARAA
jgi:hypothetical protein